MKGAACFAAIAVGAALFVTSAPATSPLPGRFADQLREARTAAPGSPARGRDADACDQPPAIAASGAYRTPLETMRGECPPLAAIVERFISQELGEEVPNPSARPQSADLAMAAAFAASGNATLARCHASRALAAGATRQELEELLYLTVVNAGAPRAIEAARALLDLIVAQPEA